MPRTNHVRRWSDEPCVHDSGVTRPSARSWIRSSPTAGRRVERLVDVLARDVLDEPRVERAADPEPRVAVGLELDAHLAALRARVAVGAAQHASEVLDVVPVLVRENVRLGERAALRSELRLQLVEEAEVDVDVAVGRAVERPDGARRDAAAGAICPSKNRVRAGS